MKQTAVEFLIEELNNIKSSSTDQYGKIIFLEKEFIRVLDQAKEMEKEQIIDAYIEASENPALILDDAEQYYNETFKSE